MEVFHAKACSLLPLGRVDRARRGGTRSAGRRSKRSTAHARAGRMHDRHVCRGSAEQFGIRRRGKRQLPAVHSVTKSM